MKKVTIILVLVLTILLTSCGTKSESPDYESTSLTVGDYDVYFLHTYCEVIVKYVIDEIEPYIYYTKIAGCEVSEGVDTIYLLIDEEYIPLKKAFDTGLVSYSEIRTGITLKREYTGDLVECDECFNVSENIGSLGILNGYEMIRTQGTCPMYVGKEIIVEGYNFGYYEGGCDADIDILGFYGEKDGVTYELSELLEMNEITIEELYEFYICNAMGALMITENE